MQSLCADCLLSIIIRVGGGPVVIIGHEDQTPAMGLRQGCPEALSATLFGLFIVGLHHHLESTLSMAGIGLRGMRSPTLKPLIIYIYIGLHHRLELAVGKTQ